MDVEVYIGDLNDPDFKWEGGNWSGNSPLRLSPFFPSPHSFFDKLLDQINNNKIYGKQVDWGSWVAPLYKHEIIDIIIEHYENELYIPTEISDIKRFVANLSPDQKYALVACEMS